MFDFICCRKNFSGQGYGHSLQSTASSQDFDSLEMATQSNLSISAQVARNEVKSPFSRSENPMRKISSASGKNPNIVQKADTLLGAASSQESRSGGGLSSSTTSRAAMLGIASGARKDPISQSTGLSSNRPSQASTLFSESTIVPKIDEHEDLLQLIATSDISTTPMKTGPVGTALSPLPITDIPVSPTSSREWIEKFSQQHKRKFWKNQITGKSTWEDPYKLKQVSDAGSEGAAFL